MNRNQNNYFYKDGISKSILFIQSPLAFASIVTSHDISDKERPVDNFISRERDLSQSFITILIVTGEGFFFIVLLLVLFIFQPMSQGSSLFLICFADAAVAAWSGSVGEVVCSGQPAKEQHRGAQDSAHFRLLA